MKNNIFTPYKDRKISIGQLVAVHWNAHKKTFSIVEMKSRNSIGKVLGYASHITLEGCYFKIDKSKQKKTIETGVKDRHAFVVGRIKDLNNIRFEKNIYYNPKKVKSFVDYEQHVNGRDEYLQLVDKVNLSAHKNNFPVVTYEIKNKIAS
ncbi:hypothetical protein RVS70_05460 [Virgibacillus sp. M23]|uniref:hypothetical protein n=1 Tax=Virgibacillus sp. M23 TaxID=3079030 RepID=UPI002A915433|nr:hypothetical protein [Virgibacillus sp. M23]MDY7043649.1 hypothetical protein [Virgibacillus sp. M23]